MSKRLSHRQSQWFLTAWLLIPIALIAGLMWVVVIWMKSGPLGGWNPPRVGAGAGDTGGANAIGEAIEKSHHRSAEKADSEAANSADETDSPPSADGG